jgi:hypothetical protein
MGRFLFGALGLSDDAYESHLDAGVIGGCLNFNTSYPRPCAAMAMLAGLARQTVSGWANHDPAFRDALEAPQGLVRAVGSRPLRTRCSNAADAGRVWYIRACSGRID